MAVFNLLNQRGQEFNLCQTVERYIQNTDKAKAGYMQGVFVTSNVVDCMDKVAELLGEKGGAKAIHFTVTFDPKELTDLHLALEIAQQIGWYIAQEYQVCFAVHDNTEKIHIHFVFNSLSYLDGHRYTGTSEENLRLADYIASVLNYSDNLKLDGVFRAIGTKYSVSEPYGQ